MILAVSSNDAPAESGRVAVSTVIGMVLGVFSLFGIVIAYQFVPRTKKLSPSLRSLAPPPSKPTPLLTRLRTRCTTLLQFFSRNQSTQEKGSGTHRSLRSLHLSTERKQERNAMRQNFAKKLRLRIDIPEWPKSTAFDEKPRLKPPAGAKYKRLEGDEESQAGLLRPDSAVLSPWSPSEEYYPSTPSTLFSTSSSPRSPSPVYPSPLKTQFLHRTFLDANINPPNSIIPPSVTVQDAADNPGVTQALIEDVEAVIQYTKEWTGESPFVVADDDDTHSDAGSDASSDWGTTM